MSSRLADTTDATSRPGLAPRPVGRVRAWDGPTRAFKWTFVALVLNAWLTYLSGDAGIRWHILNGYAILILLVFRLIWGFAGSSTARFSHWVVWPWRALGYALAMMRGRGRHFLGHNPIGGQMIIALLTIAGAQAIAGLFTVDNNGLNGGPFSNLDFGDPTPVQRWLSRWHHLGFYVLMGFATIHILVNIWYQTAKDDPIITAMVTGRKPAGDYCDEAELTAVPHAWARAAVCLAVAAAIVLGTVRAFGGKLPTL